MEDQWELLNFFFPARGANYYATEAQLRKQGALSDAAQGN